MMKQTQNEFIIDDGLKTYYFKNQDGDVLAEFSFNATDTGIISRYESVASRFETLSFPNDSDLDGVIAVDNEVMELFNELMGKDVKDKIFGVYKPLTALPNGNFYFEQCLELLEKIITQEFDVRIEKKKANIKKATKKYTK